MSLSTTENTSDKNIGGKNIKGNNVLKSPTSLLLITGTLIGFNFPLGKIAGEANVSPMIWALLVSVGVCSLLLPNLLFRKQLQIPKGRTLRYAVLSALISFVIPNLLLFSVIPHAGAGYTGLMFALSPVFTLALATLFRLKTPNLLGITGIAIGLVGAIVVSITRAGSAEAPELIWIIAAILIPLTLACGNIYRTIDWPENALPDSLAFWSHSFAIFVFIVLLLATTGTVRISELAVIPWIALTQAVVAGLTFPVFFRLQQKGGPVLLSQIGYVAAAVGLITATFILGERYSLFTWGGAGIIAMGIVITIISQRQKG
ncbi:DMT family transporter [Kiloniella sp. EL199]|uniref:DMT family transporter n=1 Tax=Kiloniella sp. EL199 TaxID=2107581 RepID=UPI000EA2DB5B|nr:DMT family transporter [Kiloniella sp. EL199]